MITAFTRTKTAQSQFLLDFARSLTYTQFHDDDLFSKQHRKLENRRGESLQGFESLAIRPKGLQMQQSVGFLFKGYERGVSMVRVYLDNCCFNRPYDDQRYLKIELETKAKLKIQELIVNGELELAISYILEQENDDNPFLERKAIIDDFFKYAIININESQEIIKIANAAMAAGLKV